MQEIIIRCDRCNKKIELEHIPHVKICVKYNKSRVDLCGNCFDEFKEKFNIWLNEKDQYICYYL